MKTWSMYIFALLLSQSLALTTVQAAEPLQTQYGINGEVEVDLLSVSASGGILTAAFAYRNTGTTESPIRYAVTDVYFLEKAEGKKYHVLTDSTGKPLATPLDGKMLSIPSWKFKPGARKLVWFKFPAPPETIDSIELVLPDALPFESVALTQ